MNRPAPVAALAGVLALGLAATPACTVRDTVATGVQPGAVDGGSPGSPGRDVYCAGQGPPILAGDSQGNSDICAGELAATTFQHALCACGELVANETFTTDSFDSRNGAYAPDQPGNDQGSVAIGGKLQSTALMDIRGSLTVAGDQGVSAGASLTVAGNLADLGPLGIATGTVSVGRDARVAGDVELAALSVGGTLTVPADRQLVPAAPAAGALVRAPVDVAFPCACAPSELIDIGGYVEAHRANNHNAAIDLDADDLASFQGDTTLVLPCGRFFLNRVQSDTGDLSLVVEGRTALFIGQGITLGRSLQVDVSAGGELDLFIAGHVNIAGDVRLGAPDRPGLVRLYVGGAGAINLSAQSAFGGNLYAPLVDLSLSASVELFGSAFVNRLLTAGTVAIHYDTSVRDAADRCPVPGPE